MPRTSPPPRPMATGTANLRSTVQEAPVRSISRQLFFPFLEIFCRFLRKINSDNFFMSQKFFQSEKLVGRKNFKKQIGEIKKITRKILTEGNLSNGKTKKVHQKKFVCKKNKKNWIGQGAALVASAAAPAGAARLPPRPAAARAAGQGGSEREPPPPPGPGRRGARRRKGPPPPLQVTALGRAKEAGIEEGVPATIADVCGGSRGQRADGGCKGRGGVCAASGRAARRRGRGAAAPCWI